MEPIKNPTGACPGFAKILTRNCKKPTGLYQEQSGICQRPTRQLFGTVQAPAKNPSNDSLGVRNHSMVIAHPARICPDVLWAPSECEREYIKHVPNTATILSGSCW